MKCKREGCDGTICMMYRSVTTSNLIGKSLIYLCEKCGQLYVLNPEAIDPIAIKDGRDQVLLFLERCLAAAEHAQANYVEADRSYLYKIFYHGEDKALAKLERNRKHILELLVARAKEVHPRKR